MIQPYTFDKQGRFELSGYNRLKPFSSFLPGLAGLKGKPIWAFYVNRGQGIASFGVQDKDGAILEFQPANKSYQAVSLQGFRTFIKLDGKVYEPFAYHDVNDQIQEKMTIESNALTIESIDKTTGIAVQVTYFVLPNESFAALVRHVSVRNLDHQAKKIEIIDGLPGILPYGLSNAAYKELGHTLKSWMDVYNLDQHIPFYKLRASTVDSAEVTAIEGGHFMLSFGDDGVTEQLLHPIVDADLVFGSNSSLITPDGFREKTLDQLMEQTQVTTNKVPSGFATVETTLPANGQYEISTIIGHVHDVEQINARQAELVNRAYIAQKLAEARQLTEELTSVMATKSADARFDAYCRQSYMDNALRGGHPIMLDSGKENDPFVYHVYSRKHGDLERDYNFFSIAPSYYSQGNGNFRDANQNRRSDTLINPDVKDFNVRMFMNFIQADGYNPLVIQGCSFQLNDQVEQAWTTLVAEQDREKMAKFLSRAFTPGGVLGFIENERIQLNVEPEAFLSKVLSCSEQYAEAVFGEGYWIDHWTYNMDLIESYLSVYPDQKEQLLFGDHSYMYYDSPADVLPRDQKTVLANGKVRRYNAVRESEEKEHLINSRKSLKTWMRVNNGHGDIYKTCLYEKLVSLALMKFATLDPEGIGVEMEANKPGWNDSLNGLPGLFASGFGELCELQRVLAFIVEVQESSTADIQIPEEIAALLAEVETLLDQYQASNQEAADAFMYWDKVSSARECYREKIRFGFEGELRTLRVADVGQTMKKFLEHVEAGIAKGLEIGNGVYPTYFCYEAVEYKPICDSKLQPQVDAKGNPYVQVTAFKRMDLPYFLEGPVRAMKTITDTDRKRTLYQRIQETDLYDRKLHMYKVNASLAEASSEIGRSRAFTPGWLENGSVFLHMSYKYLLELLKGELYNEFFTEMKHGLVPFLDPAVYGRSTLENSSFIASSANPDPSLHGTGFVARLSGSTAEFISMWNLMMWGKQPFVMEDGQLRLRMQPALPAWLFDSEDRIQAVFLGEIEVIYHNPSRKDTFGEHGAKVVAMKLTMKDGQTIHTAGQFLEEHDALQVRNRNVSRIEITLN